MGLRPRDDKSGIFHHEGSEEVEFLHCHCEEGTEVTDAAIHRVLENAYGVVYSVVEGQWIATPQEARDEKRELRDCAVRLLVHSGSPRASPSR